MYSEFLELSIENKKFDCNALAEKYNVSSQKIYDLYKNYIYEASDNYEKSQKGVTKITSLIGEHPRSGIFFEWCKCEDIDSAEIKNYRKLSNKGINQELLIENISDWIIKHHTSSKKIKEFEKKKAILNKYDFKEYVSKRMPFPTNNFTTQKGNFGEIILAEYLKSSSKLDLLIFKLRFNPNIEQSMKGDDVLLFDKKNIQSRIIMGEAKYRKKPSKKVVEDIVKSLAKDKLPISLSFIKDRLDDLQENLIADQVDNLISNLDNTQIIYVGFLYSNHNVHNLIENHLNTDNKNLVIISYGEENPEKLIKESYEKAMDKMYDK